MSENVGQEMGYTKTMDKEVAIQTLRGKCETINEILGKANGLAESIVGLSVPSGDQDMKEPAGTLESLANELVYLQKKAESLLDYLIKMDEMI